MDLGMTPYFVGAVIIGNVAAAFSICSLHRKAGSQVDQGALFLSLGFTTFIAFLVYMWLSMLMPDVL